MPPEPGDWLRGVAFATALRLNVLGKPVPCPRPQVTRMGHAYYPKAYSDWRVMAKEAMEFSGDPMPLDQPMTVAIEVRADRPRTSKLAMPRGDVDNYAKSILDLLTKVRTWLDDSQVGTLVVRKRWAIPGYPAGYRVWIAPETITETD